MRILGIESSSLVASTAIYEDGITMAEYTVDFKMTHSQTLLPMPPVRSFQFLKSASIFPPP